jgi:hypothetical protein
MATKTKSDDEKRPNPFPGLKPGYVMTPDVLREMDRDGKLMGHGQYMFMELVLRRTACAEGQPEWFDATLTAIAKEIGCSVNAADEFTSDAAERGFVAREKVGRSWRYKATWQNWKNIKKYQPKKAARAEVAEAATEVPPLHNATRFVVKPGPFRRAITLAEAVGKFELAGDLPYGIRCEYGFQSGTLLLNLLGSEEKANDSPSAPGASRKSLTDSKVVTTQHIPKIAKTDKTPPDALEAWAQTILTEYLHKPVPAEFIAAARAYNVPVHKIAKRFYLRKKDYKSHGMLPLLARDVAEAERTAGTLNAAAEAEVAEAERRYMEEQMARNQAERQQRARAEKKHGAGGES